MKLLRLWREYDSIKAAVLLFALASFLIGYCLCAAVGYAALLQAPTEYICAVPDSLDAQLTQLSALDSVKCYSRQKTAVLALENQTMTVTLLSAAYLSDCYGINADSHTVYANHAAFTAFFGEQEQGAGRVSGTLDDKPFSAEIICADTLPQDQPFAVMAVSAAELHDTSELRICMTEPDASALGQLGLQIENTEVQISAEYEKELVLLRIRFSALAFAFSLIAAGAFLRVYKQNE